MSEYETGRARVLVVDDEKPLRTLLAAALRREKDYEVFEAGDGEEARAILETGEMDVAITDLVMPRMGGEELMRWGRARHPEMAWIILSGQGTMTDAIEAVRMGAFDFVPKGTDAIQVLLPRVRNAVRQRRQAAEAKRLRQEIEKRNTRLKRQVAQLRQACGLLCRQAQTIQEDFRRAAGIQRALLPREAPQVDGVAVDAVYRPCDRVGGDLYDVVRLGERHLGICVADAAGHGVAAAMLAVVFKTRLRVLDEATGEPRAPREIFDDLNDQLAEECRAPGMFVSAVYCLLDTVTHELTVASAGHPPVLVQRHGGRVERIGPSGPALGLAPGRRYRQAVLTMEPGDRMLIYTDGLHQGRPGRGGLTPEGIAAMLADEDLEGIELLRRLLKAATRGERERQEDDITLLSVSLAGAASRMDNCEADAPTVDVEEAQAPGAPAFHLTMGHGERETAARLAGQGDWTYAGAFHEACRGALEEGRALRVDLTACEHLDSTFLGTIHELVTRADQLGVPMRLQGVGGEVRALFEELGMALVLEHVAEQPSPLPEGMGALTDACDPEGSQRRVLGAHEALAAINEHNRQEFGTLVEYLRKEFQNNGGE